MIFKRVLLASLLVLVMSPLPGGAPVPVIAVVGDSLSAGFGLRPGESWVSLLEERLAREGYGYRVVNASITGDTTSGGLARLPSLIERESPSVVIVELGGNDGLRGLPVARMEQNLKTMIDLILESGAAPVLAGIQIPPNYGPIYTERFRAVFPNLADQYAIPLIDFILDGVALNPEFMQADGIHPNAEGQPVILDNVWPVVVDVIETRIGEADESAVSQ